MIDALGDAGWAGYLLVFAAAATPVLEILLVIPAGIAVGLAPGPVALVALAGNLATVALVTVAGDRLRSWWRARRHREDAGDPGDVGDGVGDPGGRGGRARRIAERWGVPGLALIAPLLTGSHIGAMAALALGGSRRNVLAWMAVGLVLWTVISAVAAVVGLDILGVGG